MKTMVEDGILFNVFKSTAVVCAASLLILIIGFVVGYICELVDRVSLSYNIFLGLNLYDKTMVVSALITASSLSICILLIIFDYFLSRYKDIKYD